MVKDKLLEVWKDIKGYEGLYQVSNLGRVKSLPRNITHSYNTIDNYHKQSYQGRFLTPNKKENGYLEFSLYKNKQRKHKYGHRLVAEAFIPNSNNYPQVNHIDEDKENNYVNNLEWCTVSYNNTYGTRMIRKVKNTDYTKNSKKIIGEKSRTKIVFYSVSFASKFIHVEVSQISAVLTGRKNTVKGWTFSYAK